MKKLVVLVAAVSIASVSFSQDTIISRQSLTQSQNKLLKKYRIDYVGCHNYTDTTSNTQFKIDVNDCINNIKSIEVIESYSSTTSQLSDKTNLYWGNFGFTILVEDFSGNITDFFYTELDTDLDCPQCYVY
jgi:hypothetical protein